MDFSDLALLGLSCFIVSLIVLRQMKDLIC